MLEVGNSYIHFTKYGGVNKGTVVSIGSTTCIDTVNKVTYLKFHMRNDKSVTFELDGSDGKFFKVEKELSDTECENIKRTFESLGRRKEEIRKKIEKKHESRNQNHTGRLHN